jgi:hypothetical protein
VRSFLTVMVSAIVLGGCTAGPMHWAKPGATQETFMQDRHACLQQRLRDTSGGYEPLVASCMVARGYKQDRNGDLFPPPEPVAKPAGPLSAERDELNPQFVARQDYTRAVANYRSCLATNLSNPNACDELRHIMDTDVQILSAPNVSADSNIRFQDKRYSYTE